MSVGQTNPLRQQMINMMYLVLTALLAMNVSAEILKAFETVNEGMYKSIDLINLKNNSTIGDLKKLFDNPKTQAAVKPFFDKAQEANKISEDLYKMIEGVKDKIIVEGKGINPETGQVNDQANLEIPTRVLVEEGNGDKIEKEVISTRKKFIDLMNGIKGIDPEKFAKSSITLNIEKPKKTNRTWAEFTFHMVPNIAAITLLTKIEADIKNTQANILDALLNSIGKEDFKVTNLIPIVNVTTGKSAVAVGEKYEAEILLAAYDNKSQPEIFLSGRQLEVKDGKATYTGNTASQGSFDYPVEIKVANKSTGEVTSYNTRLVYDVFNAPAIVSPTKMLVLYAALENPVSVSVPGYRPQDITATIEGGGTLKADKNLGDYLAVIPDAKQQQIKEVNIKVFVKTPEGGSRQIGTGTKFRVKTVPKPIAYFGSKEGGDISVGEIKLVNFISVRLNDFAFEGLRYTVKKYKFVYVPKKGNAQFYEATSPALSQQMKQAIGSPAKGDLILITDIYASFPGSSDIRLPTALTLTVR
jgi:gliding motility-associated protein GldM